MENRTRASIFMSKVLRHKPTAIGTTLDSEGWCSVEALLKGLKKQGFPNSMEFLESIVETDNKKRYSFNEDKTLIRANQGHSIPVNVPMRIVTPPEVLYHGTAHNNILSILERGILSGLDAKIGSKRLMVHLSDDTETARVVGKRHGKPVIFAVDTVAMLKDGYVFKLSDNNVWQSESIPPKYIKLI